MMRPSGLPEVDMKVADDAIDNTEEAQVWLEDSKNRQTDAFNNPKARFREASGEVDLDLVVFGTAVEFMGESRQRDHLLFKSVHLRDATPMFNEEGLADGMFRLRRLPIRHLAQRFGENKLSEEWRKKLDDDPDQKVEVLHAVTAREDGREGALLARNLPFSDQWIELETKHEIASGGFHEFPFMVPRWDTTSGEDYGRSPGMIALPDADTLQAMGETILIAGQRAADPPLAVPNDGTFDTINTFPGGLAYYDIETAERARGNPFFSIESGANLPISRDMQLDTREQVLAAFFKNVLNLPIEGPEMTATEIIARKEEFMCEVGPIFGRWEATRTVPEVERGFMIILRGGGFAPIPDILSEAQIVFEYDSPVKRIRKQIEAAAAKMWAAEMIELGQVKPGALDLINEDEIGRFSADAAGLPKSLVNSEEVVAQVRQARQEAAARQAEFAALDQAVSTIKTGAEAVDKAGFAAQPQSGGGGAE
jgi:hypothetical protein